MAAVEPDGRSLVGKSVRLDVGTPSDAPALFAALDDARVFAAGYGGGPAGRPATPEAFARWWAAGLADGRRSAVYVVRLVADRPIRTAGSSGAGGMIATGDTAGTTGPAGTSAVLPAGTIVGTSSLGDVSLPDERIHLGWTAYAPAVWGSAVNPECKLLLLRHAFADCGFGRVKIQTDLLNTRSQAAIARLGAVREGVLRRHQARADGTFRDTVVFSILRDEWPAVEAGLVGRLERSTG